MIVYNGAAIYDTRKKSVLFSQPLTTAARCYTAEIMAEHPYVGVEVLRSENAYVVRNTEYEKRHIALCGVTPCYCTLDEVPEGDWLKVLFAMAPDKIPDFVKSMGQKGYTDVDFVQSADIFYEMLPHGVTKGSALEAYRHLSGMENVLFIAAGDYDNDIDMLRAADFSAVPANGVPGAKTAADAVLKRTCEEGAMEELIDGIMNGVFPLQKP
jgi:hydroxymethylpyrimidine pyrophosphatase-like HAD family hydrolase